ncbi:ribonuclease Z [Flavobacterium agricola]|uniref:Ribonuclease Z n=1 Tax=Flavobacterium agricola TaxID=2870839 RepID=A0ABY6M084_9FLAO|nr:ribonuclease Z [Flavobacterium agricola]UYW01846.1 ribonuclease Z [Flavobacterium agricola]
MKLHILGCTAATPRTLANPTAQVLETKRHMFLIDCGEGTQVQLRRQKLRFARINHIFISHLHGDHFFGLIGLISTFMLLGRTEDLHIFGPKGIKEIILLQLKLGNSYTAYKLYFHELESKETEVLFEDDRIKISTIPLAHRIYTNGFLFQEKETEYKLNIPVLEDLKIPVVYYPKLKQGGDIVVDDLIYRNADLTFGPLPQKSYAFCSDTKYYEAIVPIIANCTALYHESTFLEKDAALAAKTGHSTAKEAAKIAQLANAKQLILGHFSSRYNNTDWFKQEAITIFPAVTIAYDGLTIEF